MLATSIDVNNKNKALDGPECDIRNNNAIGYFLIKLLKNSKAKL